MGKIVQGTNKKDNITVYAKDVKIITGNSRRHLSINNSGNNISGLSGNDTIIIRGGSKNRINGGRGNDVITVTGRIKTGNKVKGGLGNDKIYVKAGSRNTIYGNNGADTIYIKGGSRNTIYGGSGNDTIYIKGGSKNTIYGGSGNDTFVMSQRGSARINDYKTGEDTLTVTGGTVTSTILSGNHNIIFKSGSGTVILKNAAGKTVSLIDSRGSYTVSKTEIKLDINFKGTMDASKFLSTVKTIDGSNAKNVVNIAGNAQDNIIYVGKAGGVYKGGTGNDTLYGGAGNDILYGGANDDKLYGDAGNDTLVSGSGNDYLYGGYGNDKLYVNAGDNHLYGGNEGETAYTATGTSPGDLNDPAIPIGSFTQDSFYFGSESTGTNIIYDFEAGTGITSDRVFLGDGVEVVGIPWSEGSDGFMKLSNGGEVQFKGCAGQTFMVNNEAKTFVIAMG